MRSSEQHSRHWLQLIVALLAGLALRCVFVCFFPDFDGDSGVYGTIARNMLQHHAYALDNPYHLTLIRLPGYPAFLAAVFAMFGAEQYQAVRWVQVPIDLAGCWFLYASLLKLGRPRAALCCVWIAALCPFTANYVALPMTETLSIFMISASIYVCATYRCRAMYGRSVVPAAISLGILSALAISLRPDAVVLFASVAAWFVAERRLLARRNLHNGLLCFAIVPALFCAAWAARNYSRFHVLQPLAPRYANDPTERVALGYIHWSRTWQAEYISSPEIYWEGDDLAMDPSKLPDRAFDSADQRTVTDDLIWDYNHTCKRGGVGCSINPVLDARFERLAEQRTRSHPFRTFLLLPVGRLVDMWLRPRIEYLPVHMRWWEWDINPWSFVFGLAFSALNMLLVACAVAGYWGGKVPLAPFLLTYILLRCLLLAFVLENAEPRYTLEMFPMLFIAAATFLTERSNPSRGRELTAMTAEENVAVPA